MRRNGQRKLNAFTLVEFLIVIGIISILIGILLPVLSTVQKRARETKCQSNMRQVTIALFNYAADNKGKFPPNIGGLSDGTIPSHYWCDPDRIGKYFPVRVNHEAGVLYWTDRRKTPVLLCPEDDFSIRSYAMNFFASCTVRTHTRTLGPPTHPRLGQAWNLSTKGSSKLILLAECISCWPGEWFHVAIAPESYRALEVIQPFSGLWDVHEVRVWPPGRLFVGDLQFRTIGDSTPLSYMPAETPIDWSRHRRRGDRGTRVTEARGRANFAFGDGHIESFRPDDLADRKTGRSKFVALRSPWDYQVQKLHFRRD